MVTPRIRRTRRGRIAVALAATTVLTLTPTLAEATAAQNVDTVSVAPGDEIRIQLSYFLDNKCTAGVPAVDALGHHYLLSSGHCVDGRLAEVEEGLVYRNKESIGYVYAAETKGVDYLLIRLFDSTRVVSNGVPHTADMRPAEKGRRICFRGAVSGKQCGEVKLPNSISLGWGYALPFYAYGTVSTAQSKRRDSGAAVYSSQGVVGVLSSPHYGQAMYVSLRDIYRVVQDFIPGFHIV